MTVATVTSKGQITIPADIRAKLDIKSGDQIVFFKTIDGGLGAHVRRPKIGSGRGMLTREGHKLSVDEMQPGSDPEGYDPGGLETTPVKRQGRAA